MNVPTGTCCPPSIGMVAAFKLESLAGIVGIRIRRVAAVLVGVLNTPRSARRWPAVHSAAAVRHHRQWDWLPLGRAVAQFPWVVIIWFQKLLRGKRSQLRVPKMGVYPWFVAQQAVVPATFIGH
jgi:hypothetical protein